MKNKIKELCKHKKIRILNTYHNLYSKDLILFLNRLEFNKKDMILFKYDPNGNLMEIEIKIYQKSYNNFYSYYIIFD